jgi:4-hydroxy 2-oxovalerate aldolase
VTNTELTFLTTGVGGNCTLELLLGFLKNPKFDIRPVLDLIEKYFMALKKELRWGYEIPYAITGILNKHPRAAKAFMKGVHGNSFSEFYGELVDVDDTRLEVFSGRLPGAA